MTDMKKISTHLLMTALVMMASCGENTPELQRPADAGTISGPTVLAEGASIRLTIDDIDRATTYRWYRDNAEVEGVTGKILTVDAAGTYKVAGVNAAGEGAASADHVVTLEEPDIEYIEADFGCDAYYFADGWDYGTGAVYWIVDVMTATGGVVLGVNMDGAYDFERGELQVGTYTLAATLDGGEVLNYLPGGVGDSMQGSYGYEMNTATDTYSNVWPVTGGTIQISKSGDGYLITTDLEATDSDGNAVPNLRYRFEGNPEFIDRTGADIEIYDWAGGNCTYYADPSYPAEQGVTSDITLMLFDADLTYNPTTGVAKGDTGEKGKSLQLKMLVPPDATRYLPVGEYPVAAEPAVNICYAGNSRLNFWKDGKVDTFAAIVSGTVKVVGQNEDTYTIELKLVLEDGRTFQGTYTGDLLYRKLN